MKCDCCERDVERAGSRPAFPSLGVMCPDCFIEWYDGDRPGAGSDEANTKESIGGWIRKKHGLEPLPSKEPR